jgi:hypothetical protein
MAMETKRHNIFHDDGDIMNIPHSTPTKQGEDMNGVHDTCFLSAQDCDEF